MGIVRVVRRGLLLLSGILCSLVLIGFWLEHQPTPSSPQQASIQPVKAAASLEFPLKVPGTTLVVEQLQPNSAGQPAIRLKNVGSYGVESAQVVLEWSAGFYEFYVEMLPAQSSVLLLEENGQPFETHHFTGCTGSQRTGKGDWLIAPVRISAREEGIQISNHSAQTVESLTVYFKDYQPQEGLLSGSAVYLCRQSAILPGQTVLLESPLFRWGGSQIVRIAWDNAKEY